jgi:hypothetical protein
LADHVVIPGCEIWDLLHEVTGAVLKRTGFFRLSAPVVRARRDETPVQLDLLTNER